MVACVCGWEKSTHGYGCEKFSPCPHTETEPWCGACGRPPMYENMCRQCGPIGDRSCLNCGTVLLPDGTTIF